MNYSVSDETLQHTQLKCDVDKYLDFSFLKSRVGHRILLRSACKVLLRSFKECNFLFLNILRLMKPKSRVAEPEPPGTALFEPEPEPAPALANSGRQI